MKQANNNEVDLLLRSLAKGRDKSQPQTGPALGVGRIFSDHLDADELNCYAEGVVPAPARARYIEHLADCEACRSIVIDLAQASGAASRHEVPQQQGGSNFWQTLAALFSPAVLRYAVPALVLTAVIGISLLALRQERQNEQIAQNPAADSERSSTEPRKTDGALSPATGATPSALARETQSGANSQALKDGSDLKDQKTQVDRAPSSSTDSTAAKAPGLKDPGQPEEDADVATMRPYAPEPKAAAPPPPTDKLGEAEKSVELAKEQPAKREDQARSRDEFRNQTDDIHGPNRSRSNTATPSGRTAGVMGGRGPSAPDKNKKASGFETRGVSGRRFAREGDVWVDTDYEWSRATIKVARGSDQFRALVADEPGIRAIADQLSGVVIVVWKNRAYRIQ